MFCCAKNKYFVLKIDELLRFVTLTANGMATNAKKNTKLKLRNPLMK
jgi:hypothetical protein